MKENTMNDKTCPRCGFLADEARTGPGFPEPGALSRWDNKTTVCTACGTEKAGIVWQFGLGYLHPATGARRWIRQPDGASLK